MDKKNPYQYICRDSAIAIRNNNPLGTAMLPDNYLIQSSFGKSNPLVSIEKVIFGLRIPYLPELSKSSDLIGQTDAEKIQRILEEQSMLIANLSKWKGMAFSLRYLWQPEKGEIQLAILAKGLANPGYGAYIGEQMYLDIRNILNSQEYPVESIDTTEELDRFLKPMKDSGYIVEIRQKEDLLYLIDGDAFVVYPFGSARTTWIPFLRTLCAQTEPCVVNIHIEPTFIFADERESITRAAQIGASLSDYTVENHTYTLRLVDPHARIVAGLYTELSQNTNEPFLVVVQVGSNNAHAARNVAQVLASELTEQRALADAINSNSLPTGYELVLPRTKEELQLAHRTLTAIELQTWGATLASRGKERFQYFANARTAASAFRFPVPVRGGLPGIRTVPSRPDYSTGVVQKLQTESTVLLGNFIGTGGIASLPVGSFSQHMLVAGTTGSGKTTTCMRMLDQLWKKKNIPFLVIEPARNEYRTMLASDMGNELRIFTLGEESISPFRLNPLEILPGVSVEAHKSFVQAIIEASLPTFGILPSLIQRSLNRIYLNCGWNGKDRGQKNDPRRMPTLADLYYELIRVTEDSGYAKDTRQDVSAAAAGRIAPLLIGNKGLMLNTQRSTPMAELMTRPTILELDILNDEEKAVVMGFILMMIREYCRTTRETSTLQHVLLIEEAHRVMGVAPRTADRETSSDAKGQSVSMFSSMLSEIRGYGEGIIIAEQIPNRLIEDARKNTNTKIVHRLLGDDDRKVLAATMNIESPQEEAWATLEPGEMAIFYPGLHKPALVKSDDYKKEKKLPERLSDENVRQHMQTVAPLSQALTKDALFAGCAFCSAKCQHRENISNVAFDLMAYSRFWKLVFDYQQSDERGNTAEGFTLLLDGVSKILEGAGLDGGNTDAAYCYVTHMFGKDVSEGFAARFKTVYARGT